MVQRLIQRHGGHRNALLNLLLLGLAGAVLIRLATIAVYTFLPNNYFLEVEYLHIDDICYKAPEQRLQVAGVRHPYPDLPDSIVQNRQLQAELVVEVKKTDGRKIDDLVRHPVIEWRADGYGTTEWNLRTTMVPGTYYADVYYYLELPVVGKRDEPIHVRTNTFKVLECNQ